MVFGTSVSRWLAFVALGFVLWVARGVLPPFIIAGILAYVLSPLVDQLAARTGVRRPLVALGVFVVVLLVVFGLVWIAGARLGGEIRDISRESPSIVEAIVNDVTGGQTVELFGQSLSSADLGRRLDVATRQEVGTPTQALQAVRVGFELLLAVLLVFISLAYMLIDGRQLFQYLLRFVPSEHRGRVESVSAEVHRVLGRYLRGQLMLVVLMSAVTFAILEWGFHLPYALGIGVLTGLLEIIPLIGPIAAATIACTVGFSRGGASEAAALAMTYLVLRQLEDQLIMPIVVGRAVHVHPLVTIFSVLVGEKIGGVLGMILAVPVAASVKVVLDYAYREPSPDAPQGNPAPTNLPLRTHELVESG